MDDWFLEYRRPEAWGVVEPDGRVTWLFDYLCCLAYCGLRQIPPTLTRLPPDKPYAVWWQGRRVSGHVSRLAADVAARGHSEFRGGMHEVWDGERLLTIWEDGRQR